MANKFDIFFVDQLDSSMFIEADILMDPSTKRPIMAHPPQTSSDLTFAEFLQLSQTTSKGLKLDFKDINAITSCLIELETQKDNVNFSSTEILFSFV